MLNIILVDDSPADATLFEIMLKELGVAYSIKVFNKVDDAIEFFTISKEVPDVVILDLNICSASGFEVLHWLRAQPIYSDVKVAIYTTSERLDDKEEAEAHNASFYFKGWDYPAGLDNVRKLVDALEL